jgi:hypothetical protein
MQPSLPPPNDFEMAVLRQLARKLPALAAVIPKLRVIDRQYTPCGSYTDLDYPEEIAVVRSPIGLSELINMPGVAHGMDGPLLFKAGGPDFLEIVACGGESWDGRYEGFSIPPSA